jgi:Fe2+ transport system protein FeoA
MLAASNYPAPLSLASLPDGEKARIVAIKAGPGSTDRLASLGLVPGISLKKLSSSPRRGPIVVERGGGSFALAWDLADSILLAPLAS